MIFLGWNAAALTILYYVDTMVSFAALLFIYPPGEPRKRDDTLKTSFAVFWFGLIFAGWTFAVAYSRVSFDWLLVAACLAQVATASEAFAAAQREFGVMFTTSGSEEEEARKLHSTRFLFVFMRFPLAVIAGLTWAPLTVVLYAGATIYYELAWRGRKFPFPGP